MLSPTCRHTRIKNSKDAHIVFHAVWQGKRPMFTRRLDTEERRSIQPGDVFVWEERGPSAGSSTNIERWTDSIRWGPSRVREDFLFYTERPASPPHDVPFSNPPGTASSMPHERFRGNLIKQTYSAYVDTNRGRRKWHLIAYFTQETSNSLYTVQAFEDLATLRVPPGMYRSARSPGYRPRPPSNPDYPLDQLAPLEYLRTCPPPRRHAADEAALMSFVRNRL
ncbi:hypothetical protein H0H93_011102 [Arthromyces matolae]|nr:hypothetical protein H0H93_011102 [Arthromyces matolae]